MILVIADSANCLQQLSEDSIVGTMFRWLSQCPNPSSKTDAAQLYHHASEKEHSNTHDAACDSSAKWLSLRKWIHAHVRDILDESDEILRSQFQLVFTLGSPKHLDGYPNRWTITQQVLRLVKNHLHSLSTYAPDSVQHECNSLAPGSFPHVRIVHSPDISQRLISLIAEDVMTGRLPNFDFQQLSPGLQNAIRSFISDEDVLQIPDTVKRVEDYARSSGQSHLWDGLLLLRGLLTSNILLFSLSLRRWRVDYGLSGSTMLAVPYRAKDVPAPPNTQFGHPDLIIILTCLSYYYTGLWKKQLKRCFEILFHQDDPRAEYALWIKECGSVPDSLRELSELDLRSLVQWDNIIFPHFAWNQATIDFYLSRVVFPKEATEFPWKISGSSWDLAEKGGKLITGERACSSSLVVRFGC